MKIKIIGGGPAGLYFAILMKKLDPAHHIIVYERDGPNDTFGWGIVFSDQTFSYLRDHDLDSYQQIISSCEIWDNVDVVHRGQRISIGGNKFSGIARIRFLNILHQRCRQLGVELRFHTNVTDVREVAADADLLVGADGANSLVRRTYQDAFQPSLDVRANKYIWLGTPKLFHALTLTFRAHADGLYIAHSYKFSQTTSTFIVECDPATWSRGGFQFKSDQETCAYLADVFKEDLEGQPLLSNNFVKWLNFVLVKNARWFHQHVVLLGDALHTAHFSIGSGTKLALEDAIALASCFQRHSDVTAALAEFERVRRPVVEALQQAAYSSLILFENARDDMHLEPIPFAYKLMTRSERIDYEKLKKRDPNFIAAYDRWRQTHPSLPPAST
ncbi:MAG: FAD-dependent monooxygenase [Acidobacteriota bacterium]|nr:FAD-dependent monooxygenase [Blastocatellia bacterium]MDW8238169.1 FAD-dependent monooxygenase [Acidobacteriota bacterium]